MYLLMHSATVGLYNDLESVYVFHVMLVMNRVYLGWFFFVKDMQCVYCEVEPVI